MPGVIVLSNQEAATNSDILQGTRLQTVPAGGFLTFEMQSSANDASNNMEVSIQMPNGDTPLNGVRIPDGATSDAINDNDKTMITLPIAQGGHTVFSVTETGTAVLTWRVTYSPAQ
jgi:hypothetical protein